MNMKAVAYLCALVIVSQSDASCKLPFSKRCKRNDPNIGECWKSILKEIPQYLEKGIPEMGIPPIDPLRSQGHYDINRSTFYIGHWNMEHNGTKHFEIIASSVNLPQNIISLILRFPKLGHTCSAFANGTALGFQLSSKEGCNAAQADVTLTFVFNGKRKTVNGKEHIEFDKISIDVKGKYTNQEFHNFAEGGAEENRLFSVAAEHGSDLFPPLYNECLKLSIGHNIAQAIKNVYIECPLDILHPLM